MRPARGRRLCAQCGAGDIEAHRADSQVHTTQLAGTKARIVAGVISRRQATSGTANNSSVMAESMTGEGGPRRTKLRENAPQAGGRRGGQVRQTVKSSYVATTPSNYLSRGHCWPLSLAHIFRLPLVRRGKVQPLRSGRPPPAQGTNADNSRRSRWLLASPEDSRARLFSFRA
jgi:hypothetical protein